MNSRPIAIHERLADPGREPEDEAPGRREETQHVPVQGRVRDRRSLALDAGQRGDQAVVLIDPLGRDVGAQTAEPAGTLAMSNSSCRAYPAGVRDRVRSCRRCRR